MSDNSKRFVVVSENSERFVVVSSLAVRVGDVISVSSGFREFSFLREIFLSGSCV